MAVTASASAEVVVDSGASVAYARRESSEASYAIPARPGFMLRVQHEAGLWTVVDRETGIFGSGENLSDAIGDFRRAAAEHLDVLERQPSLSEDLAAQLAYL